ncbi:MAG: hypothetical protein J6Z14_15065 [Prevotella sp.]|nr:hypothetical protein [Prevotella sp.]
MVSETAFEYSNKGECQYKVGQIVREFEPMNRELKVSFNKTSLDIIIGVAIEPKDVWRYLNANWLHVNLFHYHYIPTLIVGSGYFQVAGKVLIKNVENINIEEWLNSTDESVNLVLVNDFKTYEVLGIRHIQLPMMKTIRNILKEQTKCCDAEIANTLELIDRGFQIPWMMHYTDELCNYVKETSDAIQKGEYIINEPKEKQLHIY